MKPWGELLGEKMIYLYQHDLCLLCCHAFSLFPFKLDQLLYRTLQPLITCDN